MGEYQLFVDPSPSRPCDVANGGVDAATLHAHPQVDFSYVHQPALKSLCVPSSARTGHGTGH